MQKYIDILVKVTKTEYAQKLMAGYVYMNPLEYYRKIENNIAKTDGAFDINEGLAAEKVNVLLKTAEMNISLKNVSIFLNYPVFCCSRIRFEADNNKKLKLFDHRLVTDFVSGNSAEFSVLFIQTREFINRFRETAIKNYIRHDIKPVIYEDFDNNPNYLTDPSKVVFRKSPLYSYQKEVRAVLYKEVSEPENFYIGDISDISKMLPVNILTDDLVLSLY